LEVENFRTLQFTYVDLAYSPRKGLGPVNLTPYAAATYALMIHWGVGIAISVAVADQEEGLIRDHPQYGRRLASRVVPPMALIGLAGPLLTAAGGHGIPPLWMAVSVPLMIPFAWISWLWSRSWVLRTPAWKRRRLGYWSAASGLLAVIPSTLLALHQLDPAWRGVIPMSIFTAGVALPGALTNLTLMALTAGLPEEVPGGKTEFVAEMGGVGLLIGVLAIIDVAVSWLENGQNWPPGANGLVIGWGACAIAIPGLILLVRAKWRGMPDRYFMPAALGVAVIGLWMAYLLIFRFPGLVPPHFWG
jgi:hypothetical protein